MREGEDTRHESGYFSIRYVELCVELLSEGQGARVEITGYQRLAVQRHRD